MKTKLVSLLWVLGLCTGLVQGAPLGTAFTYQGSLTDNSRPAQGLFDFRFSVFDAPTGGTLVAGPITNLAVPVQTGLFTTELDFGSGVFTGQARWLEIAVRTNGGAAFVTLAPRQPLTATPYACYALTAPWSGLSGIPSGFADGVDNDTTYTAGTGLALAGTQFSLNTTYTDSRYWRQGGNDLSGEGYLGTTTSYALNFLVNNQRALRLEPTVTSPNVIGGSGGNSVSSGVVGATIAGGGASSGPNIVTANHGTVGGGSGNTAGGTGATVGGGSNNTASGWNSTVAGGGSNTAENTNTTIGGGYGNTASGGDATIGGGYQNTAGYGATVGGGYQNTASGNYATIPGGDRNVAAGNYSFAAGRRAKANHAGAFVWADSTDADFSSTTPNQFAVRARGGVTFMTDGAGVFVDTNKVWHAGNHGPGSGLDADTLDGQHASAFASAALIGSASVYEGSITPQQLFSMASTGWAVVTDGDLDWDHTLVITTTNVRVEYTLWYGGTVVHGEASVGSPATITFPHYQGFQLILARYDYIASLVCNENDGTISCVYQKSHP